MIRLALIDGPLAPEHPALEARETLRPGGDRHAARHAAVLAEAVLAVAPGTRFVNLVVFGAGLATDAATLARALDRAAALRPDLALCALGMARPDAAVAAACAGLVATGCVVVAAAPARGAPVFPAALPGVLSVQGDARCGPAEWSWLGLPKAEFGACPAVAGRPDVAGASAAAAAFAGLVAARLASGAQARDIAAAMRARAAFRGRERRAAPAWGGAMTERPNLAPRGGSHVVGDTRPPLREETIPALLAATVAAHGPREAAVFVDRGLRWSWDAFAAAVDRLATGLLDLGIGKGDRVGIWAPNRPEWLLTQFATARIGAILVNVNPAYRVGELEYALAKVGCRALILADAFKSSDYLGMVARLAPELAAATPGELRAATLPALRAVIRMGAEATPGMLNFDAVAGTPADPARLDAATAALRQDDPINIQFTSGTTGLPKGATLTHRNIVNNAHFVTAAMRFTPDDRLAIPVPLYHCFGMVMGTLGCVTKGATMVFPGEGFDPVATLRAAAAERCTAIYGVPTMFAAMLDAPGFADVDLTSLRTGIMAGSPCPIEIMRRVARDMHMSEVTIAYGMTETSPVSFQSSTDDPLEKRVTTVGRAHPHLEIKLIDAGGATVPVGATGELCTRGYSVMQGYWDEPAKTAEAIDAEGWMHSGDLATIDDEGYCNIVGRLKDLLIRGGENVYPREIEEHLFAHPAVQMVQVFGVPDPKYGEEVAAWIVLRPGAVASEEDIRAFCRDRLAHYKVPRYVRFRDELPMTVTGKAQKFVMRAAMVEELGLEAAHTA
jgi:fatty-acyl-CoA synthase